MFEGDAVMDDRRQQQPARFDAEATLPLRVAYYAERELTRDILKLQRGLIAAVSQPRTTGAVVGEFLGTRRACAGQGIDAPPNTCRHRN